jgi:hypothetical protein
MGSEEERWDQRGRLGLDKEKWDQVRRDGG